MASQVVDHSIHLENSKIVLAAKPRAALHLKANHQSKVSYLKLSNRPKKDIIKV